MKLKKYQKPELTKITEENRYKETEDSYICPTCKEWTSSVIDLLTEENLGSACCEASEPYYE